jgi:peptidyl-prolyl cis-trans isomerase D
VDVDGRRYTARDVWRIRERQEAEYRRALGDAFDASNDALLDEMAASTLMRMALLAREAEQMGLRASDQEIRSYLRAIPGAVDDSGRLDKRIITDHAERQFGSVRRFQEVLRDELLIKKISRLMSESVAVSEAEARDALRHRQREVQIAFVRFDGTTPLADLEVSDGEREAFLAAHPERVVATYDERSEQYDRPERVRARHILVRLPEDADPEAEEAARERMDAIAQRIRQGADFVDVALESSEDTGTQEQGGDLGFFSRGDMVKPFEEAAFSLEPGAISEVIRTTYGLHLIRVEEKRAATVVPLEDARDEIARDLIRSDKAVEMARARAEALSAEVREGRSLVEAARKAKVPIERTEPIRYSRDGYVPGLGPAPDLLTAAFALTKERPSSTEIFEPRESEFVLIQLLERTEPPPEEIEAMAEAERQRMLIERRAQLEQAWIADRRDALAERGRLFFSLKPLER